MKLHHLCVLFMASLTTCRGTDDDPNPQSPIITNLGVTDFLSTVEAGNYLVADCDRHPFGEGNIVKVLKATQDGVKGALDSPERSIVYQNFFKNADQAVVNAILTNVANGTNMTISDEQRRPTIVCANPHEVESAPHSREACKGNSVAAAVSGHPYVFLCTPSALLSRSPDPNDCVGERPDGHYGTGQKLVQTQTGILLHMLMDMYLSTTSGFGLLEPKAYGLRKVLLLNTTQSLINPSNYVFYVSNIMANCTEFDPWQSFRPFPDGHLLENGSATSNTSTRSSTIVRDVTPGTSNT